ncbi:zinc finger MYM-type protein 1-like [Aphis craccivora]|uniref:Zinc finger MYM-type protein 1-like n=1 Tax=Aphis craccivora TaxID=307492 RepID=A0A6G0XQ41_APHCR|nr:zinc finger MYM-type protein 1-like [Aphis craccivora]
MHFLIKLFCTIPVSTATPKRSFSTLKRSKTYLRSTMNEVIFELFWKISTM